MKALAVLFLYFISSVANAQEFELGQAWTYETRDHEAGSILQIFKIDEDPELGRIYSIAINGVEIKLQDENIQVQEFLPHIPISEEALRSSVISLIDPLDFPAVELEGYDYWKTLFDKGEAGVFTVSVREIVDFVEETLNKGTIDTNP